MNLDSSKYKKPIVTVSLIVGVLGISVIVSWILNVSLPKSVLPGYVVMKFNTALCLIFISISILLHAINKNKAWPNLFCFLTLVCGLLTFSQDLFDYNLGLDQLFVTDFEAIAANHPAPGRMSPLTAICFILISLALGGIKSKNERLLKLTQILLHTVTLLAFIAIVGYLFNIPTFYKLSFLTSMAVHTAIAFFLLSLAASLVNPSLGLTGLFTGNGIGNLMARKLFLQMLVTILSLTYIRILTNRHSLVSVEFGIALFSTSFILASLFLIRRVSYQLNGIDLKKKLAEDNLTEIKRLEEKFKALLESTPDALVIVDETGNIVIINQQTERIFGYKREEIVGKKVEVLIPERFRAKHPHNREVYSANPRVRPMGSNMELFARKKDGTEFPVEVSLSPLKSERLVLSTIRDITKNKEQEEELRKYSILEAKSKEMEQFAHIASHDLRHPLLTILNYIKIFDEDYADKLDEEGKYCLQAISGAAHRMDTLILGLLDYSRLSQIKELEIVNCNETIQAVLADLNSTIKSTKAKITVHDLPTIRAYPIEIRQLFQNLVTNALKFNKSGTTPELIISAKKETEGYRFEFRDNGIGIEEKDMEKLFLIFQRLHPSDEYEGTGLGLAYCKKIVEMHHGKIWVESTPNQGSSFYFTIKT